MKTELRHVSLRIPARLECLYEIGASLQCLFAEEYALSSTDEIVYSIELATQEIATNIVRHAYANDQGDIDIEVLLYGEPERVTIIIQDNGKHFDPSTVKEPDLGSLQVHGYGLFLANELMDHVDYQRADGGNKWVLQKELNI